MRYSVLNPVRFRYGNELPVSSFRGEKGRRCRVPAPFSAVPSGQRSGLLPSLARLSPGEETLLEEEEEISVLRFVKEPSFLRWEEKELP